MHRDPESALHREQPYRSAESRMCRENLRRKLTNTAPVPYDCLRSIATIPKDSTRPR